MSALLDEMGERVRERRDLLGLTQQQVGDAINLSRSSVANIEGGRQELPLTTVARLADVLQLTIGALCGEEPIAHVPAVSVLTVYTVLCEECGNLGDLDSPGKASDLRREHMRSHLTLPAASPVSGREQTTPDGGEAP